MQRNKYLGVALAAGLAVTAVSACGGGGGSISLGGSKSSTGSSSSGAGGSGSSSGGSASGNVTDAIKSIGNSQGVQLTLSLEGTPSSFGSKSGLTPDQAQAVLNTQLVIATHTADGKSLTQSTGSGSAGDFQIAVVNSGANLGTFEVIGSTLYARVDINKTAQTYGLTQGKAAAAQQELQQASTEVPGLSALSAGQWVSLDLTPLLQLEQKSASTSTTTAGVSPASEKALIQAFITAFEQNSTITEIGPDNGGTKYHAVVREKALVTALGQAAASVPGLSSDASKLNTSNIPPTQTLTIDVVIKNGQVTELQLPLNQFDMKHELGGALTLDLGLAGSPTITAPSGATAIDISGIISDLGALSKGAGSGSSGSSGSGTSGTTGDTGNTGATGGTGQ